MPRHYTTMPFQPSVKEKPASPVQIATLLNEAINRAAQEGWIFQGLETVRTTVNPGCLAMFSGPQTIYTDILVFYQDR
jgi:hypothetical protein